VFLVAVFRQITSTQAIMFESDSFPFRLAFEDYR
jgi:hypothetical protein